LDITQLSTHTISGLQDPEICKLDVTISPPAQNLWHLSLGYFDNHGLQSSWWVLIETLMTPSEPIQVSERMYDTTLQLAPIASLRLTLKYLQWVALHHLA
jgi:hypothetical protein